MAMNGAFVDMGIDHAGTAVRVCAWTVGIGHVHRPAAATANAREATIEPRGLSGCCGSVTQWTPPDDPDSGRMLRFK